MSDKPLDATAFLAVLGRAARRAANECKRISECVSEGTDQEIFDEVIAESEYARDHIHQVQCAIDEAREAARGANYHVGDDYSASMRDARAGRKMVRLKLRRMTGDRVHVTLGDGEELWTSNDRLRDWIIVTYDEDKMNPRSLGQLRRVMNEKFGPRVLLVPNGIEICVFEKIGEIE